MAAFKTFMIDVSIIIVSYNTKDLILKCFGSIGKYVKGVEFEVIVVDNASSDASVEAIKNFKFQMLNIKLISNRNNRGFGAANNQGIKIAKGRYILLLNPDTELVEDSVSIMVNWMDLNPQVGISSCKLIYPDGSIQPTGGFFPNILRVFLWSILLDDFPLVGDIFGSYHPKASFYKRERLLDWVTGAFFLVRREVLDVLKGFDEDYFLYVEEVDFCYRAKKRRGVDLVHPKGGRLWVVQYVPITSVIHHKGASGTTEGMITREFLGLEIFYKKHYGFVEQVLLRLFLFVGCLVRVIVFAIMNRSRAEIYVRAITKI